MLVDRMIRLQHFSSLTRSDLEQVVKAGTISVYPADTVVMREEDPCSGLFVLLNGQIYLYKTGPEGQENILAVVKPVIMFNEVAVLDGGPNPVTAVTAQESELWHISCAGFKALIQRYPAFALGLLPVLAARNRFMIAQYEDLSFRSVRGRLAKLLLDLSENGGLTIDRRQHTISDLAARIATVPEAISRSLGEFRGKGFIISDRWRIEVKEPEALAELAQIGMNLA
jgi:CRP-like cAMP-binding protein